MQREKKKLREKSRGGRGRRKGASDRWKKEKKEERREGNEKVRGNEEGTTGVRVRKGARRDKGREWMWEGRRVRVKKEG